MKKRYNSIKLGFILGVILPVIALVGFYLVKFNDYSFSDFLIGLWQMKLFGKMVSLAAISNLVLFFIFIRLDYLYSARGVLASTILITFIVIILRII